MTNYLSGLQQYIDLFKDLKKNLPNLKKSQDNPEKPESKNNAIEFLWALKTVYSKIKGLNQTNIPHYQFLEKLDSLPNDKAQFEAKVKENMFEIRNNKLFIKTPDSGAQPIGDFSSSLLNEIENWALAILGTFK